MNDKSILTTIHAPEISWWARRTEMLDREAMGRVALVRRIVAPAPRHDALVPKGSVALRHGYNDLIAGGLAGRRSGAKIVLDDCAWEVGSAALQRLVAGMRPDRSSQEKEIGFKRTARAAIRAVDSPRTFYCVQSDEVNDLLSRPLPAKVVTDDRMAHACGGGPLLRAGPPRPADPR